MESEYKCITTKKDSINFIEFILKNKIGCPKKYELFEYFVSLFKLCGIILKIPLDMFTTIIWRMCGCNENQLYSYLFL